MSQEHELTFAKLRRCVEIGALNPLDIPEALDYFTNIRNRAAEDVLPFVDDLEVLYERIKKFKSKYPQVYS